MIAALILFGGTAQGAVFAPSRQAFVPVAAPSSPVQFGQIFYTGLYDPSLLCGTRGMLWSTNAGSTAVACTYSLRYVTTSRILFNPSISSGTACSTTVCIDWLYANHPDWIMYLNDQTTIAWEFGNTIFPPVDTANSDVQTFLLGQMIANSVSYGYRGVGIDNASMQNSFLEAGHYSGTTAPCLLADRPACGGTWVQQYGGVSQTDTAWQYMTLNYFQSLRQGLARVGLTLFANLGYQLNDTHLAANLMLNGSMAEDWSQFSCTTSANNTLNGFTVDALWKNVYFDVYSDAQGWWFGLNYLCGHDTSGMTQAEESWGVANFLLVSQNSAQNYLAMILSGSSIYDVYPASANPPIGTATQSPPSPGQCGGTGVGTDNGVCTRTYSNGMVAVNSSGENTRSFTVPAGTWVDQFCNSVSPGSVSLAPATALVVVGYPNAQCP